MKGGIVALGGLKGGGVVGFGCDVGQLGGVGQVPLEDGVELTEEFFDVLELFLQFLRLKLEIMIRQILLKFKQLLLILFQNCLIAMKKFRMNLI